MKNLKRLLNLIVFWGVFAAGASRPWESHGAWYYVSAILLAALLLVFLEWNIRGAETE